MKKTETASLADLRQIARIISGLNLLKMNIGMYPAGHASIGQSADQAYAILKDYFQGRPDLNIGVTGDTLLINDQFLDKNNKNFQEYARVLHIFRVIFLKLKSNVTRQELFEFSKILTSKPSDVRQMEKLEGLLTRLSIKGIEVRTIDTEYFQLSEEKKPRQKAGEDDFWREFIVQMSTDQPKCSFDSPGAAPTVSPAFLEIIRKLNENSHLWKNAVTGYEKMVGNYLHEHQADAHVKAEKHEVLGVIANLMDHFHPELKEQLLGAAQKQLSLQLETALGLENLNYLPEEMLSVIIQLANERQRQIPPAFLMLLTRLSTTGNNVSLHSTAPQQNLTTPEMERILKKEKYEEYIPEKYDQMLKKLSDPLSFDDAAEKVFPLSEYLKSLEDENIDLGICQLVFALLEEEQDEENYLAYSNRLALSIPGLLKKEQFSFLMRMIETLRGHGHKNGSEKIRRQALSLLSVITAPETIAPNITPFLLSGKDTAEAANFLVLSGSENIPWLFDLFLDPSAATCPTLVAVIKEYGVKAVEEATKRMTQQTPAKALRILSLLREVGNDRSIPLLKELYACDDYTVKKEVLEILFFAHPPDAVHLLQTSLSSPNAQTLQEAVCLTILFEVSELMGQLMALFKTFYIRETDTILNELIVRQLCRSGHSWAVPYLETIAAVRLTLSPRRLSLVKEILFASLENFRRQDVQALLEKGSKSWNGKIRESCLKIMAQKEP